MTGAIPKNLQHRLRQLCRSAKLRATAIVIAMIVPIAAGGVWLVIQLAGTPVGVTVALAALLATILVAWRRARRYDLAWLSRQLDAASPEFEDSTALALTGTKPVTQLQALQQVRVEHRLDRKLAAGALPDLRPAYPQKSLRLAWLSGLALAALAIALPTLRAGPTSPTVASTAEPLTAAGTVIVAAQLSIIAPAYTSLSVKTETTLDAKFPSDSRVAWTLKFDREASAAALVFHDGTRLPLVREGASWRGARVIAASTLYRIELEGAPPPDKDRLNRLDAIPDQPPEIVVRAPEKTLNQLTEAQKNWTLAFEARDDYGLGAAELSISLAQGTGDKITVSEQKLTLDGGRDPHQRSYRKTLDLTALGFGKGDDLIVRLSVADNHAPQPNHSNSASFILRWPPEKGSDSLGLEGLVQKATPAFFRSQRQIIIDTEALIAERPGVDEKRFSERTDNLGIDQKVLRLRYGQFLGEGFESAAEHAPAEVDADSKAAESLKDIPPDHEEENIVRNGLGQDEDVLHEFGHAHDAPEAATLLDPETRRILRAALDEMWQAELNLRQALPEKALPYEYRALDYIKQVQQAERIYLARAGLELPQVDAARRLSGERAGLSDRDHPLPSQTADDSPVAAIWQTLTQGGTPDLPALGAWLRQHPDVLPDPLDLIAAADRVQREPDCTACRDALKARLWPLLPTPSAAVTSRRAPDAAGAAWLDALSGPTP